MELVVARYEENLNWLRRVPRAFRITIYDKSARASTPPASDTVALKNIGREAHTYLHHICARFDSLAEVSVFCQGKPFDHAFDFHKTLRALAEKKLRVENFFWLGHFADTDSPDGTLFQNWSKNQSRHGLDLNKFHHELFGAPGPHEYSFFGGAQFMVTRVCIEARPREFYEQALQLSQTFPEAAHCFERVWDRVFGQQASTRARLSGEKTLYLKPIKRLLPRNGAGS